MTRKSSFTTALKKLLIATAVGASMLGAGAAQAGVLNFEQTLDNPFVFAGDRLTIGEYYLEGAGTAGFVGAVVNNDSCFGVQCPTNNSTNYYTALDDGYLVFGLANGGPFRLGSLDASFIGAGLTTYPSVAALLYVAAYDAAGFVAETYLNLAGPVGGSFKFATYDLSTFGGGRSFTDVLVASFACDASGNCNRTTNQANFALDNVVTVPEPGSFALLGLGLLGLRAAQRRRTAA